MSSISNDPRIPHCYSIRIYTPMRLTLGIFYTPYHMMNRSCMRWYGMNSPPLKHAEMLGHGPPIEQPQEAREGGLPGLAPDLLRLHARLKKA